MNPVSAFFQGAESAGTVWITDFDGVLFRGRFPGWTQGISNAEFGTAFLALHGAQPLRWLRILGGLLRIARLGRQLNLRLQAGELARREAEILLIRQFTEQVLRPGLPERLEPAGRRAARFCNADAFEVLCGIRGKIAALLILSKAFMPVLESAAERLRRECGLEPILRGVPLNTAPSIQIAPGRAPVLTGRDKADHLRRLAARRPEWKRALCVGDTEEDIPMFAAARELFGSDRTCCLAVPARDRAIARVADAVFPSWAEVRRGLLGESPDRTHLR